MKLKKKRFRDTPASGNTVCAIGVLLIVGVMAYLAPIRADAEAVPVVAPTTITLAPIDVVGQKDCMPAYYTAELIMQYRQDGLDLATTLTLFDDSPKSTKIVKQAFRVSQFDTDKYQKRAVKQFAEEQYNLCEDER